ncbi:DUF6303 family protein [Streptomyces sp. CA-288835]|uniref:DUF6303 family protein n=1 Tax=Streptomyces sp. CA-288835 TaxID=3240069 RepID=UPI003D8AE35B
MTVATRAQIRRVCCDWKTGVETGSTRRAYWELYVVVYGTTDPWPSYAWPVSRRHSIPTMEERRQALASLGFQPTPGAEWEWQESETPDHHGHPSATSFLGTISIVPLEQVAEGGDVA